MSDDTIKTCFTDGLAEALSKEEEPLPVMVRGKDGELRALTNATVTRITGPDGTVRRIMVLNEGESDKDRAPAPEEMN